MVERRLPRLPARWPALPFLPSGRVARVVAPALFLLAVTAVALVVRAALQSDPSSAATTKPAPTRTRAVGTTPRIAVAKRYYVIRSGDTLGAIASRFATTVEALLRLNSGIEPTALIPGHQIRVK